MMKVIEGQKLWEEFKTNGNVGTITTYFSTQFIERNFDIFALSKENFVAEISLYGLDTIFVDNHIFETDHEWYKARRGELVNYCKNNDINIVVIRNTKAKVNQTFKKAFVMEINPDITNYHINGMILQAPIIMNEEKFNPVNSSKNTDITYYSVGKITTSSETQKFNVKSKPVTRVVSEPRLTSHNFKKLSSYIKKSHILYISHTELLDTITLRYIEVMALLNSTYVIYNHTIDIETKYGFQSLNDATNLNQMKFLLGNKEFLFKKIIGIQRKVLKDNTFIFNPKLNDFLLNKTRKLAKPKISIITSTNRKHKLDNYLEQLSKQNYVEIELNLVTHGFELTSSEIGHYKTIYDYPINFQSADGNENLGSCLNKAISDSSYSIVTKMDDDDFYFEHYLIDQYISMKYSQASVVGKYEAYYYFEQEDVIVKRSIGHYHEYGNFVLGATIMTTSKVMKDLLFEDIPKAVDTNFLRRAIEYGVEIYATHPFEMCVYRSADKDHHTWKVSNLMMLKNSKVLGYGYPKAYVKID